MKSAPPNSSMIKLALSTLLFLLLQACAIPRWVVIHDGLKTTVVDAVTKQPIQDAYVFVHSGAEALARSDQNGHIELQPKRKLEWILLLSEGRMEMSLRVCKAGYAPYVAVPRGGWNADLKPIQMLEISQIELSPAPAKPGPYPIDNCD